MLAISIEMIVYTEILNITNVLALPFWAWAVESLGNGASGTDDVDTGEEDAGDDCGGNDGDGDGGIVGPTVCGTLALGLTYPVEL